MELAPGCHVFFAGIGGVSMSGLAHALLSRGFRVSGSASSDSPTLARLGEAGETVTVGHSPANLDGAPEVVSTDKQMLVDATYDEAGQALVTSLRSRFILRQGDQYQVASRVSTADAASLRAASVVYPQWVTDRYLQLPDSLTPQTLALAEQLAAGQPTPDD